MSAATRRTGLGKGLAALIPAAAAGAATAEPTGAAVGAEPHPREIPIASIRRNPYQPREHFHSERLDDLIASVREHGVLQPIVVTPIDGGYQLIAGERRTRAAEAAGLTRIPAVVRSADELTQLSLALVENLQRADLNGMEEARAYRRLMDEFGLTQEEVARRVGRSRPTIANTLRLLSVAPPLQDAVADGRLSEGHARALAGLADHAAQTAAMSIVLERGLSVRDTETLVRQLADTPAAAPPRPRPTDPDVERLETELREALGTRVSIAPGRNGGKITITWFDDEELSRLVERLTGGKR